MKGNAGAWVHVEMDRQEYRQKADEARDQGEPGNGHRPDLRCDNPRDHRSDERAPSGAGSASRHGANESALFHPDVVESGSSVESDRRTRQERTVAAERLLTLGPHWKRRVSLHGKQCLIYRVGGLRGQPSPRSLNAIGASVCSFDIYRRGHPICRRAISGHRGAGGRARCYADVRADTGAAPRNLSGTSQREEQACAQPVRCTCGGRRTADNRASRSTRACSRQQSGNQTI